MEKIIMIWESRVVVAELQHPMIYHALLTRVDDEYADIYLVELKSLQDKIWLFGFSARFRPNQQVLSFLSKTPLHNEKIGLFSDMEQGLRSTLYHVYEVVKSITTAAISVFD